MALRTRLLWLGVILSVVIGAKLLWRHEWDPEELRATVDLSLEVPEANLTRESVKGPVKLALCPLGLGNADREGEIADWTMALLSDPSQFVWVERGELEKALQEMELERASVISAEESLQLGRILGAEWLVIGTPYTNKNELTPLVRVVETRSSAIRSLMAMKSAGRPSEDVAEDLAQFLMSAKEPSASEPFQTILAVGAFPDMGVRQRKDDFGTQFRRALMDSFHDSNLLLLERDMVSQMLEEADLAAAGVLQERSGRHPLQPALWVVHGIYQTTHEDGEKIDLVLTIERVAYGSSRHRIRGAPGADLLQKAKAAIEEGLAQPLPPVDVIAQRRKEFHIQMEKGVELSQIPEERLILSTGAYQPPGGDPLRPDFEKRRAKLLEAIKAFETALLLDPSRDLARLYLGACLVDPAIDQVEEARDYYREVIAGEGLERDKDVARLALGNSYLHLYYSSSGRDPAAAAALFRRFADEANGPRKAEFEFRYREALRKTQPASREQADQRLAELENQLIERLRWNTRNGRVPHQGEFHDVVSHVKKWSDAPQDGLVDLSRRLEEVFPHLTPHIRWRILSSGGEAWSPLIERFSEALATVHADPGSLFGAEDFFRNSLEIMWDGARKLEQPELAVALVEVRLKGVEDGHAPPLNDRERVKAGYTYFEGEQWEKALEQFEALGAKVIGMWGDGPWGPDGDPFQPRQMAKACRDKLGIQPPLDPTHFELGRPYAASEDDPFAFAIHEGLLWTVSPSKFSNVRLADRQQASFSFPQPLASSPVCMVASDETVWAGFDGDGLVALNLSDGTIKRYTEADGLLLNHIAALHFAQGRLWIGYGRDGEGGVGAMDVGSGRIHSFAPSLTQTSPGTLVDPLDAPPRKPVTSITASGDGLIWLTARSKGIQRYAPADERWEGFPSSDDEEGVLCIAAGERWIAAGAYRTMGRSGPGSIMGGLCVFDYSGQNRSVLTQADGLPSNLITAVAFDGNFLWVGGFGFLAVLDADSKRVLRSADTPGHSVRQIHVGEEHVWVHVEQALYRVERAGERQAEDLARAEDRE